MGVGLYTSRLILEALGVVDYGIYGLVGGVVTMFGFLNSAMSSATQRYLSFDIGTSDQVRLQQTFNASLNIHFLIAGIILLFAETIGLWFVNYKLNIPVERMSAANWVYQLSIFTFLLGVVQVPYNALIIAREHMNIYAYMSILEVSLKLGIVFIVLNSMTDRLILYAVLIAIVAFLIRLAYMLYCKRRFKESVYKFYYEKKYYKELLSYSGWNLFGNIASIARGQGSNILLNLFFGPVANAAYALTLSVQGAVGSFVSSFQTAVNPQIIKNYAKENVKSSANLIFKSSKFSFFAMLLMIVPILTNIEYVLHLWLGQIPPYTVKFIQLALIYTLIETTSRPIMIGIQATGKIKAYQAVVGILVFLNFPIIWLVFKYTGIPEYTYLVFCIISILSLILRLYFLKIQMGIRMVEFVKIVLVRIASVVLCIWMVFSFTPIIFNGVNNILDFLLNSIIIVIIISIIILLLGFNSAEKLFLKKIASRYIFNK